MLDSNVLIEIFDKNTDLGQKLINKIERTGEEIITSSVCIHEVLFGMVRYEEKLDAMAKLLGLNVLPYTKEDAVLSAKLEYYTEKMGVHIRKTDAMIAAIAINNKVRLYTVDKKHFHMLKSQGLELVE
jgi:predicted nucleic acid-binding protein